MTESAGQPAKPRTWRPMAVWTAGIVLALGLAWFVGAVVARVRQVRRVVLQSYQISSGGEQAALRELGGPTVAAPKLVLYLRLPAGIAPNRHVAAYLLCQCGDTATPVMATLTCDPDRWVRWQAATWLADRRDPRALPPLFAFLQGPDADDRKAAAEALGKIGDPSAIDLLEVALQDEDGGVRAAAVEALKKIMGVEAPK